MTSPRLIAPGGVTLSGASDDLIEVDGAIRAEWSPSDADSALVAFSDGTVLRITYTDSGVWRVATVVRGAADLEVVQAPEDDDDNYSDVALAIDPADDDDPALNAAAFALLDPHDRMMRRALVLVRLMIPDGWNADIIEPDGGWVTTIEVHEGEPDDDGDNWRFAVAASPDFTDENRWACYFVDDEGEDSGHPTLAGAVAAGLSNFGAEIRTDR